jgi:uncharacterized protein (DUF2062 family)
MRQRLRRILPSREVIGRNRWLRWMEPHLMHPRLWHFSRRGVAMGVALGVFFGLLVPIGQIPLAAGASILLRVNVPAAIGSTLVTNPVTFGPIYYAAYRFGRWVTGEAQSSEPDRVVLAPEKRHAEAGPWARLAGLGKSLLVGLSIVSTAMGLLVYFAITWFWRWRVLAKRRKRGNP